MKKEILFVINNLNCGGAEKALISILETIDYSRFNVDLFLFKHEGIFLNKIPRNVNVLEGSKLYKYYDMPIKESLIGLTRHGNLKLVFDRVIAGFIFKSEKSGARSEQKVWKYLSSSMPSLNKKYDVAIGFLEKNPIYYCVEKVKAKKKIGFIHNDYNRLGLDPKIDNPYFEKLDNIVTVSEVCANVLQNIFPSYNEKIKVIYNIVSPSLIKKMSLEHVPLGQSEDFNIVSVARLNTQKGLDMAILACKLLVDKGYRIKWYVIGEGEERKRLEFLVKENNLETVFILLGTKENPYPYIRNADIYVQPSRFEGKSIAIDEAKILSKPIVVTNFSTVNDQISHLENGVVVDMSPEAIHQGIELLINDFSLKNKLIENLSLEDLGTEKEINNIYRIL